MAANCCNALDVIGRRILGQLVLADIGADDAAARSRLQPRGERRQPLTVKTEAVDDAKILVETKQARQRIARLRQWRHAAGFDKAETGSEHRIDHFGMFVKTGSETDRIAEIEMPHPCRQHRIRRYGRTVAESQFERGDGETMRGFRCKQMQQRQRCAISEFSH